MTNKKSIFDTEDKQKDIDTFLIVLESFLNRNLEKSDIMLLAGNVTILYDKALMAGITAISLHYVDSGKFPEVAAEFNALMDTELDKLKQEDEKHNTK